MLYFSKTRILFISIFSIILIYLCLSNFFKYDDNFINKKINLGLDLQGGSYLLLEIDNTPVILKTLQNSLSSIKKFLKDKNAVQHFPAEGEATLSGIIIEADHNTGLAKKITRLIEGGSLTN